MLKIIILLVIPIIIFILISCIFDLVITYELLQYKFRKMKLGLSFGKILSKNQLRAVLQLLLEEDIRYGVKERRINIFSSKWQFIPFYLYRQALAYILRWEDMKAVSEGVFNKDSYEIAYYCLNNNIIEIYEFNLIRWCEKANEDKREYIIKAIFHEYRHKYQYNTNMILTDEESEEDAENFEENFFNKNKTKIQQILSR